MSSPESLAALFDDGFFADYEHEVAEIDLESQAQAALADILTVQSDDGSRRTYEQIKQETETFFANPLVRQTDALLDSLSRQYMQFCMDHGEGGMAMNDGVLSGVFDRGLQYAQHDGHGHDHDSASGSDKTGKDKKKEKDKKQASRRFWELLFKNS